MNHTHKNFVLFGTSDYSVHVATELKNKFNIIPALIVTVPDAPKGRKQILTKSPLCEWAIINNIPVFQPAILKKDGPEHEEIIKKLSNFDVFLVASYGKIIPQYILDLPSQGSLNLHPSLLPLYRGPSPIQYQIKDNAEHIGSTLMLMDAEVDHGNIVAQEILPPHLYRDQHNLPKDFKTLEHELGLQSAKLAASVLIQGESKEKIVGSVQDHSKATFTKMIQKEDALIDMSTENSTNGQQIQLSNYLKYLAFIEWPRVFFIHNNMRVVITEATYSSEDKEFIPIRVIPEGKKEMSYADFVRGHSN